MADHTHSNVTFDCDPSIATQLVLRQCQEVAFISGLSSSIKLMLESTNDYYSELNVSYSDEKTFAEMVAQQTDDATAKTILAPYFN